MAYEDLLKDTSQPSLDNKNYFTLTITDLDINTTYPLQFRWKYNDGTFGAWSAVKSITTPGEATPATPSALTIANNTKGYLEITWDGKTSTGATMINIDRLDIYIDGAPFDSTKPADSLFAAGTKTIVAPAGTYIVSSYAVSKAGTKSAYSTPVTRTVLTNVPTAESSVTPSTPTVSSVLGAIQLSWNGKTSSGADQPYGFNAAKVYIGTSSGFTPSSSNQVDTLKFANGQNTLNIGVGTVVNGTALDYGIDYYVKIATTNGTDTSTAVSASGNPVRIGQVTSGDIVTVTADKIATGTLSSGSTITVGSTSGKHILLSGTGDPLTIYGSGGVPGGAILSFNGTKLSIVGDGTFSGNLSIGSGNDIFKAEPATGIWLGNSSESSAPFSVSKNGVIRANSGTIGGWTLTSTQLQGTNFQLDSSNSTIYVGSTSGDHIRISASGGIQHTNSSGSGTGKFTLSPNGNLTLSGAITATSGSFSGTITSTSGTIGGWTIGSTSLSAGGTTLDSSGGLTFTNAGSGLFRLNNSWLYESGGGIGAAPNGAFVITQTSSSPNREVHLFNSSDLSGSVYVNRPIYYVGHTTTSSTSNTYINPSSGYMARSTASSQRYKENIVNLNTVSNLNPEPLLSLPIRAFKYKSDYLDSDDIRSGVLVPGFIAEEMENYYPAAVDYNDDGLPERWNSDFLIPGMLALIQQLNTRLDALEG